jgi:hypothetical protein
MATRTLTIIPKKNATSGSLSAPSASALQLGEIATNTASGEMYLKREDSTVGLVKADAKTLMGRALSSQAPSPDQILKWDNALNVWIPSNMIGQYSATTPVLTTFTGNGTTKLFAVNGYINSDPRNYIVVLGGQIQQPDNVVYTVSPNGVLFNAAPAAAVTGFILAYQAPSAISALGYTTQGEIDKAFRGDSSGILAIGNSYSSQIQNTDPKVLNCGAEVISSTLVKITGWTPSLTVTMIASSGSSTLTIASGTLPAKVQALKPGHRVSGTGIPSGTTLVSVSSTQIVISAAATASGSKSITIKGAVSSPFSASYANGNQLSISGLVNGVFPIDSADSANSTVTIYCNSNLATGTTGSCNVQNCTNGSVFVGFGAGTLSPVHSVLIGNYANAKVPTEYASSVDPNPTMAECVSVGSESISGPHSVSVGSNSVIDGSNSVAVGYGSKTKSFSVALGSLSESCAQRPVKIPFDVFLCDGTSGQVLLAINQAIQDTKGLEVGMLVSGTGIPANTQIYSIPSSGIIQITNPLTANFTNSPVTVSYPTVQTVLNCTTVSGSNVIKFPASEPPTNFDVGHYIVASQFPSGTRVIDISFVNDSTFTNTYWIITASKDATAASTTASISFKPYNQFRKALSGVSVASNSSLVTVSSTSGISIGDLCDVYNSAFDVVITGYVAKIASATTFHVSGWNLGAAVTGAFAVFKQDDKTSIALGHMANAITGEIGFGKLSAQFTTGTANTAYLPVNIGGKEYVIPLNNRS